MIIDIFRLLTLIIFILIIFIDIDIPIVLNTPLNQMILALIIIMTIIAIDEIIGFLLGLIILIIYYKYYQKVFNSSSSTVPPSNQIELQQPLMTNQFYNIDTFENDVKPSPNKLISVENHYMKSFNNGECFEMPYISNQLLDDAQNNIYDVNNYNMELISNENKIDIYGIQGLNSSNIHIPAYDKLFIENNYI